MPGQIDDQEPKLIPSPGRRKNKKLNQKNSIISNDVDTIETANEDQNYNTRKQKNRPMQVDIERKNNGSVPLTDELHEDSERRKMSAKFPQGHKKQEEPARAPQNVVKVH